MAEKVLYIAHTEADGSLSKIALETLSAAKSLAEALGCDLQAGLFGQSIEPAAGCIALAIGGKMLGVSGEDFSQPRYASDAAAIEALCRTSGASVVLAPATSRIGRVVAGVAQRLEGRVDANATGIACEDGAPVVTRWFYRQRMVAQLKRQQRPWLVTIAPGSFQPWQGEAGAPNVESVTVALDDQARRTKGVGISAPPADEQTIRPEAQLLFVAGAGWTKKQADGATHVKDAEKLIKTFLDGAKASLGSSKSLVDLSGEGQDVISYMTHLNQVGQTGSTPRHPKGLATCCHGEEPHVVGWRFINERRAINLDANCGWAQGKADVLYVADAFEVMAQLNALLNQG
jgi:electron transfer flavoprotein alpha subunit